MWHDPRFHKGKIEKKEEKVPKGFSKGEKDLYKGAEFILEREKQKVTAEEEKTKAVST